MIVVFEMATAVVEVLCAAAAVVLQLRYWGRQYSEIRRVKDPTMENLYRHA